VVVFSGRSKSLDGFVRKNGSKREWLMCEVSNLTFRAASGVATAISEVLWKALRGRGRVVFGVEHGFRCDVDTLSVFSPI
jgi:hypothetical protein